MPAFYVARENVDGGVAILEGEEAHHVRVRRYQPDDEVDLIDGEGGGYRVVIESIESGRVTTRVVERVQDLGESRVRLQLAPALVKGARFDLIVEKATEVGVDAIRPVLSERTVVHPGSVDKRLGRWRRLARAAAKQCGRSRVPTIHEPLPVAQAAADMEGLRRLLATPAAAGDVREAVDGAATGVGLIVGPEGGFDAAEQQALEALGVRRFVWGQRILRAETAAVVLSALVLSVAEWHLEDKQWKETV